MSPAIVLTRFEDLRPREGAAYLIKGLVPLVGLTVIWGPPKCGKSFWTFDAMMHVALGWAYRGRKVTAGAVVYCAMEGAEGYGKRAEAFRLQRLAEQADQVPFYLIAASLDLVEDRGNLVNAIRNQLVEGNPVAVVLDTLNRSLRGSESDDRDMAAYIKAADGIREAFDCAVIVVHHSGVNDSRPRGHTSLTGAADAQLSVKRERARGDVTVTVEHMKDDPEGETVRFRLVQMEVGRDSDGDPITSCVVEPCDGAAVAGEARATTLPRAAKTMLRALEEAINLHGHAVTTDQWREHAYRLGISRPNATDRAQQMAFTRSFDLLRSRGAISVDGDRVWMPIGSGANGAQGGEHANTLS